MRSARQIRYDASEKGKRTQRERNARRVQWRKGSYVYFDTPETARAVRAHIRSRIDDFIERQQARAKTESGAESTVRPEAAD